MERQTEQLMDQHMRQWAQYLLIDEICNPVNKQSHTYSKKYHLNSFNKHEDRSFRIGQLLSPFYMASFDQTETQPNPQAIIKQFISNSRNTQNLSLLLNSVQQLPKLRYQQSSKVFQQQGQSNSINQYSKESEEPLNPTKLNFQTSSQKIIPNKANDIDMSKRFPHLKTADSKSQNKYKFEYSTNHRIIDLEEVSNEQNQIEANMSVRSYNEVHVTREDGDGQSKSVHSNFVKTNRKYEYGSKYQSGNRRIPYKQAESKAKEQRSMIQNYFESAKNRVLDNCGINCCQGIFSHQNAQETNQSKNLNSNNLKYGQQSTQKPFKKK